MLLPNPSLRSTISFLSNNNLRYCYCSFKSSISNIKEWVVNGDKEIHAYG